MFLSDTVKLCIGDTGISISLSNLWNAVPVDISYTKICITSNFTELNNIFFIFSFCFLYLLYLCAILFKY